MNSNSDDTKLQIQWDVDNRTLNLNLLLKTGRDGLKKIINVCLAYNYYSVAIKKYHLHVL